METKTRAAVVGLIAALIALLPVAAHAGPSAKQPAQVALTLGEARHYARTGANYMAVGLVGPQSPRVGVCRHLDGPKLWSCAVVVQGSDTRCTMDVWAWGSHNGNRFYEYHRVRCSAR